jgi:hypothetical protein
MDSECDRCTSLKTGLAASVGLGLAASGTIPLKTAAAATDQTATTNSPSPRDRSARRAGPRSSETGRSSQ